MLRFREGLVWTVGLRNKAAFTDFIRRIVDGAYAKMSMTRKRVLQKVHFNANQTL